MIIKALLSIVFGLVKLLLGLINFPDTPEAITSGIDSFFKLLEKPFGFVAWLFGGKTVVAVFFVVLIAIHNADHIYHIALWIYRKIRGGG